MDLKEQRLQALRNIREGIGGLKLDRKQRKAYLKLIDETQSHVESGAPDEKATEQVQSFLRHIDQTAL